jgi:hypothetical protein
MDKPEKRVDLNSELGMSRRDLLRRGAVVGGTLLWVAPAIQSLGPKALAQQVASNTCSACYCWDDPKSFPGILHEYGATDFFIFAGQKDPADCQAWCSQTGKYAGGGGAPAKFEHGEWCQGTNCETRVSADDHGEEFHGAFCS